MVSTPGKLRGKHVETKGFLVTKMAEKSCKVYPSDTESEPTETKPSNWNCGSLVTLSLVSQNTGSVNELPCGVADWQLGQRFAI